MGKIMGGRSFRLGVFYIVSFMSLVFMVLSCEDEAIKGQNDLASSDTTVVEVAEIKLRFGIAEDDFEVFDDTVKNGWTLSHILAPHGVSQVNINLLDEKMKDSTINVNYVVSGKPYSLYSQQIDTISQVMHFVYEPDIYSYVKVDFLADTILVERHFKPVKYLQKVIYGEIADQSNLTLELQKNFENYALTAALAEAIEGVFAWSIDFFKLQPGDQFVINYLEKSIEGEAYGIDYIDHIWFNHRNEGKYAFRFMTDSTHQEIGYYDEQGREMKRPFLMSPVKFARISSGYNLNRYHPIYKRTKAHLGTDYAAPTGTPILATADGTVTHAQRKGANGLYVKIRHNDTYQTQYLHMSKIGEGIKPGVRVKQGQTIGYVGSTGAATGPHVCYRFWKNGKQVNHRAESFPKSEPMKKELIPAYLKYVEPLKVELDSVIQEVF